MNLLRSLSGQRSESFDSLGYANIMGRLYPLFGTTQTLTGDKEEVTDGFVGLAQTAFMANPIVFAAENARLRLFTEARFQYQRMSGGRPGDLWGDRNLSILERPWPGGSTPDLLKRMLLHADLGGSAYPVRRPGAIKLARPDWVTLVLGSEDGPQDIEAGDIDADLVGMIYHPGGRYSGREPETFLREEFGQFVPVPDPLASYRGMSWLTPVLREVAADGAATAHKARYFEGGATPNLVVTTQPGLSREAFDDWVARFSRRHEGLRGAYKTMYLTSGTDAKVIGSDLRQVDFKTVQGGGETRIAAAAAVPPIIAGFSEGLAAATYSNYGQARRAFADLFARPAWRDAATSLEVIVPAPAGSRLWYDDRDIPFLQEDMKDRAEIQQVQANAIRSLVDAGFNPGTVVAAIEADDIGLLTHSGLYSVQLQPPMPERPAPDETREALTAPPTGGQ